MNKTYELVKAWAEFEETNPDASIEDFCRNRLEQQQALEVQKIDELYQNCNDRFHVSRMINQLSRLWMNLTQAGIRQLNLLNFDEFVFLYSVDAIRNIRKKDLIYMHFLEISSGLLVIDRLIKKDFLKEAIDKEDKRSKRLAITRKGSSVLAQARKAIELAAQEMYGRMSPRDLELCISLLTPTLTTSAQKWHDQKKFQLPTS